MCGVVVGGGMQRFNAAAIPFAAPSEHSHTHPSLSGPGLPPLPEGGAWGLEARERAHVRRPPRRPLRLWVQVWRVWLGGWVYDRTGSYDQVWYLCIGLSVFAALINLPVKEAPITRDMAAA